MLLFQLLEGSRLLSWQAVGVFIFLICATNLGISCATAIYNLYLHPLRKFKGPKLWIAFPICKTIAQIRGQLDFRTRQFHEKYGPVVRVTPNELTFTTAEAWKDIYGHGHAEYPKVFPEGYRKGRAAEIISSNAHDHFRFRRAMLPAFSDRALALQESIIREYVDLLIEKLGEVAAKDGPSTNMVKWYTFTTFDLIGDLAFGESFDGLKSGKENAWVSNIEKMLRLFPILLLATSSRILSKLLLYLAGDKIKNSQANHLNLVHSLATKRMNNKNQEHRGDFMDFIMRAQGQEHGLTDAELTANSDTLIVAGSETTATLLCGVTYYLLKTPNAWAKCVAEVRNAFARAEDISFQSASAQLPYMLACLDEGLRLFPPVPSVLYRRTPKDQAVVVDGMVVPPNTAVGVHHMAAYHSAANFHDPLTFHPERWLPAAREDEKSPFYNDKREAHKPFSLGPRNCIGRNLAYHEMRIILANVLWHYDMKLDPSCESWAESQRTFALWEKPPLLVHITARSKKTPALA
ncbi:cytochrome P450 [Nemania abortiva]|nr:cytochrome P450 [Nemania abortiva]